MPQYNFEILRYLRKQHGMTIHALAKKSGISFAVISKLERNQTNPSLNTVQQIAQALDISATELISMAEIKTSQGRKEESYASDGFQFRKVQYNNMALILASASAGKKTSRPEVHEDDTEVVFVNSGKVKLLSTMGDFTLKKGDSMQFDAIFKHTYQALSDCELVIVHMRKNRTF
jgi:transcriptional regulator with XRE-family HTH domain